METCLEKILKGKKKILKTECQTENQQNQQLPLMLTRNTKAELNRSGPESGRG